MDKIEKAGVADKVAAAAMLRERISQAVFAPSAHRTFAAGAGFCSAVCAVIDPLVAAIIGGGCAADALADALAVATKPVLSAILTPPCPLAAAVVEAIFSPRDFSPRDGNSSYAVEAAIDGVKLAIAAGTAIAARSAAAKATAAAAARDADVVLHSDFLRVPSEALSEVRRTAHATAVPERVAPNDGAAPCARGVRFDCRCSGECVAITDALLRRCAAMPTLSPELRANLLKAFVAGSHCDRNRTWCLCQSA
jgi:hypothetical protein